MEVKGLSGGIFPVLRDCSSSRRFQLQLPADFRRKIKRVTKKRGQPEKREKLQHYCLFIHLSFPTERFAILEP